MGCTAKLFSLALAVSGSLFTAQTQEIPIVSDISFDVAVFKEARLVSPFGMRVDPFVRRENWHPGIDIHAAWDSPIRAPATGEIVHAGPAPGYGKTVDLKISDQWTLRFAHLSTLSVELGQQIPAGHVIGEIGSTGRAIGPHLHLEARHGEKQYDPVKLSGLEFFETEKPRN